MGESLTSRVAQRASVLERKRYRAIFRCDLCSKHITGGLQIAGDAVVRQSKTDSTEGGVVVGEREGGTGVARRGGGSIWVPKRRALLDEADG